MRILERAGTQRPQLLLLGTYYLPSSPHLGRGLRAPGWIKLLRGRGDEDRVWFIFTDPHPTEKMGDHRALQTTKAPDSSTVLGRARSLTTASSMSNLLTLLGSGMPVKNSMSGFFGELSSAHYLTPGTGHSRRETELCRVALSRTMLF
jgi:hypothetical protein